MLPSMINLTCIVAWSKNINAEISIEWVWQNVK